MDSDPKVLQPASTRADDMVTRTQLDDIKRKELARMRRVATGTLIGFSVAFVGLHFAGDSLFVGFLLAVSEASMVGGLADWFAVTALFRHPMGIPIPHTAVVPTNRDRIAASLGNFIQLNFLSSDRLGEKVRELNLALYVGRWLREEENARVLADKVGNTVVSTRQVLSDEAIQQFIHTHVVGWARTLDLSRLVGNALTSLTSNERFEPLFEALLRSFIQALRDSREQLLAAIHRTLPALVPNLVGTLIYDAVQSHLEKTIEDMLERPDHELRKLLDDRVRAWIMKLETDPATAEKLNTLVQEYLGRPEIAEYATHLWRDLKDYVTTDLKQDDASKIKAYLTRLAMKAGDAMLDDEKFQRAINMQLEQEAVRMAERYASSISGFITETVQRWKTETMVERLELGVGKDLQYIRLNGTVVGGLVGGLLWAFSFLF